MLLLEKFPFNFFWGFNSLFDGRIAKGATGNQRGNNAERLVPPLNLVENFCDEFGASQTFTYASCPRGNVSAPRPEHRRDAYDTSARGHAYSKAEKER